jgi:hypothetical protein
MMLMRSGFLRFLGFRLFVEKICDSKAIYYSDIELFLKATRFIGDILHSFQEC